MIFNVCVIKVEKTELSGFARNKDMINKFNQNFLNFADKCKVSKKCKFKTVLFKHHIFIQNDGWDSDVFVWHFCQVINRK